MAATGSRGKTENLKPFRPGQSGNPSGRPKGARGLAAYISERTLEGRALADFYLSVFEGTLDGLPRSAAARLKLRMEAAEWLANRGFGRPLQPTELSGPEGKPVQLIFDGGPKQQEDS